MSSPLLGLALPPVLLWVVACDLLYRRISNRVVMGLLGLWLLGLAGPGWQAAGAIAVRDIAVALLAAALVLFSGYLLFAMRWVDAGDVKLMSVMCLWVGADAFTFLIVTALAGGAFALSLPLLRRLERSLAHGWVRLSIRLWGRPPPMPVALQAVPASGVPYGLAIAAGALFTQYARAGLPFHA